MSSGVVDAEAPAGVGEEMHAFIADLYPICRSITGEGLRETLRRVGEHVTLEIHEVPSGTKVFDWVVPREWNIRDAYVKNGRGERVIDFQAMQPARRQLQHSGAHAHGSCRAEGAPHDDSRVP